MGSRLRGGEYSRSASRTRAGALGVVPPRAGSSSAVFQIFGFTMVGSGLLLGWVFMLAFVL